MKIKEIEASMRREVPGRLLKQRRNGSDRGSMVHSRADLGHTGMRQRRSTTAGFFLESITALDFEDTFELVYHFNCYEPGSRVVVRMLCGHDQVPPSICDIFRGAVWLEREVHEFFGIKFSGNADMRPLLLPEDADYHPLRKNFGKVSAYHKREVIYG